MDRLYQIKRVREILNKYNLSPKKSLGQNFLIDGNLLKKISKSASINQTDTVLEIGTGLGTLTEELALNAGRVITVEIDKNLKKIHEDTLSQYKNIEIIYEDFLKLDLGTLGISKKIKVVSNLPYYIASKITAKLLEHHELFSEITILTQKEMAERIIKEKSGFSIFISYYANGEFLFKIPPASFIPKPKVESEVIKLKIRENLQEVGENFFELIKNSFQMKRKTLINNLLKSGDFENRKIGESTLKSLNIPINARAEDLELEDFIKLSLIKHIAM